MTISLGWFRGYFGKFDLYYFRKFLFKSEELFLHDGAPARYGIGVTNFHNEQYTNQWVGI